jgi:hypothetical protein
MKDRNTGIPQFPAAEAFWPKASYVRLESGAIESLGDFGHLPLAAPLIQFVGHQQYGPGHQSEFLMRFRPSQREEAGGDAAAASARERAGLPSYS